MNMLKHVIVCVMLAGGVFVVFGVMGCEQMCATRIVESVTVGGKMVLAMQGSPESLIEQGRIDAHRRVAVADGAEIDVWVIKARPNDGSSYRDATVVVIHPLMMSKGWFFSLGEQLAANGWDVVLPDLRAHGASGGKYVTWGAKDKRDIKTVVDKLLAEEIIEPKLYAMGASLGGCVAIQYAAFDTRCQGVLALAPPTGVNGVARRMYPLATQDWLDRTVVCAGELAGFDATDASAIDAAGKLKCPLILAHGRLDIIVPHNHSEQIYQAASGPKKLISLPLTNHVTVQVGQSGWIVRQMSDPARCRWSH